MPMGVFFISVVLLVWWASQASSFALQDMLCSPLHPYAIIFNMWVKDEFQNMITYPNIDVMQTGHFPSFGDRPR